MISPNDLNTSPPTERLVTTTAIDVEKDVMPIYGNKKEDRPPSLLKVVYDIFMLIAIVVDLIVIFVDEILMSAFFAKIASLFAFEGWLMNYKSGMHFTLGALGGVFTIFLISELAVRWAIAIKKRTYYRWFFFPFVHWYEVLGCFVLLRPLRLLRAFVLIRRLHEMNIKVVPSRWIKTAKFYGHILLEELSDRVILTAVGNFRMQLQGKNAQSATSNLMVDETIAKNRDKIEQAVLVLLRRELLPKLQAIVHSKVGDELSLQVGKAVQQALTDTPELSRYMRLIPIAGTMIESQMLDIGKHIGQNVTASVNEVLLSPELLDELMVNIAHGIAHVDTTHPEVAILIQAVVDDGLTAFEKQVKIQQWKHTEHLHL